MEDYEYYEAHAKDVKLEDITSDEDNADLLASLRDNYVSHFSIVTDHEYEYSFAVREGDHLGWLGYFVGKSDLMDLSIESFPENINLNAFFGGLGHNRSIQELSIDIDLGESFQSLLPFMKKNSSLRTLGFSGFDIGLQCARNIAMLLSQQCSLKCLAFYGNVFDDGAFSQIAIALRSQPQIEEMYVYENGNSVGTNGYVALGSALESCLSLRQLELRALDNHDANERLIDDEGLHALVEGLKHCHNLTSLNLHGNMTITEEVSRSLSTLFQSDNCQLEYLDLNNMNIDIDDDGMAVLARGLASLSSLEWLYLRRMSTSDRGLQDLAEGLVGCNLEDLALTNNMLMDSVSGLRSLGALVRRTTSMHSLSLRDCSLTDAGLQSFVEGMANCCNLTELSLSNNRSITANGLASLSSLFGAEHCSLCTLSLHGINVGDDGAAALANGLRGNKSLRAIDLHNSTFTATGWAAFSRLLCDTSSVNNTYLSNHTLVSMGLYGRSAPSDILGYLKLNTLQNHAAAISKILHSHPDIDVTPLFQFNLLCLPLVVEWFENAKSYLDKVNESTESFQCRQLSAVYRFIRGMPLVAANGFRSQKMKDIQLQSKSKSKKRTIDQTL